MSKQAKTKDLGKTREVDHEGLIDRGNRLHEARRYAAALPWFDRALLVAPQCPNAIYNRANTLHMLDRDHDVATYPPTSCPTLAAASQCPHPMR
jgi:hypothetical protein